MPIRLTSLIDVVFILLLFFMLSSRMEPMGLLRLETATPEPGTASQDSPPELHIGDTELRWSDTALAPDAVRRRLENHKGDRVRLSTAPSVTLSEFTRWLTTIKEAGLEPAWIREPEAEDTTP